MAEFVDLNLEKLLTAFEKIQKSELLSKEETYEFIKRCRYYEYKTKRPKDFLEYAEYMDGVIDLIHKRRKEIQVYGNTPDIELPLKYKCAFLYRICTDRFKKIDYFHKEIAYLKKTNLRGRCSEAYTRLLRFYGQDPKNHVEVARFEFFINHSAENARTILQMALRRFPTNILLWSTFLEIEISYDRRNVLLETDKKSKSKSKEMDYPSLEIKENDEILTLKLVEIVYEQALKAIPENMHAKLIGEFLDVCRNCKTDFLGDFIQKLQDAYDKAPQLEINLNDICEILPDDDENVSLEKPLEKSKSTTDNNLISINSDEFQRLSNAEKKTAFENAIIDIGNKNVQCWIEYLKFLLETDPLSVGLLNKRAMFNLDKELLEKLEIEWTKTILNATAY